MSEAGFRTSLRGWASASLGRAAVVTIAALGLAGCDTPRPRALGSAAPDAAISFPREEPFVNRAFEPYRGARWIGNAIAYGPYRDGQSPGGPAPSRAEIREDLGLMSRHWSLLRLYGAVGPPETVLGVIREDRLDLKVMLGAWIGAEERRDDRGQVVEEFPATRASNRREIEAAIRLAAEYPDIVVAVSVGNETQVSWSDHKVGPERLIAYLREVRARTRAPVTTVDDWSYWIRPESVALAGEVDFIVTHVHPMWGGQRLEHALDWTRDKLAEVKAAHPGEAIVLGETGWATRKHDEGEQARLIRGRPGEEEQKTYYDAVTAWAERERIPTFFFEAFDENWKGGPHPDEVEKHWGLFRADRTPKKALAHGS